MPALLLTAAALAGWAFWSPGATVTDGRHDRGRNGMWIQHGWFADDGWLERNDRDPATFRSAAAIAGLLNRLRTHGFTDVFPHVAPATPDGRLPPVDHGQIERFLEEGDGLNVLPWVGGVWGAQVHPEDPAWRARFADSVRDLLDRHPRLAGVHLNIEPCPSGDPAYLALLERLRAAMPADKRLSVAAYPPPTRWQPVTDVHWDEAYFRGVAARADQIVVMMYDTSIRRQRFYEHTMKAWTIEVLAWSDSTPVLLGLPAYEDAGVGYHFPSVENLPTALRGVHAGLMHFRELPASYQGVAAYSGWTMDDSDWSALREGFLRAR